MNEEPQLPFEPESFEAIVRRFPLALEDEFNMMAVLMGDKTARALMANAVGNRKYVFDFEERVRLIVTVEKASTRLLHISFSRAHGEAGACWNNRPKGELAECCHQILKRLHDSGLIPRIENPLHHMMTPAACQMWFDFPHEQVFTA